MISTRLFFRTYLSIILFAAFFSVEAYAKTVAIDITDPISDGSVDITVKIGGVTKTVNVTVTAGQSDTTKATAIRDRLIQEGLTATSVLGKLKIKDLAKSAKVTFKDNGTGEDNQSLSSTSTSITDGFVSFDSTFEAGSNVTAGFFTDFGSYTATEILASNTSGIDVATSLFNDILANANLSLLGIESLNLSGNEILFGFDILATAGEAGVFFGSTTSSGVVSASIQAVPIPPAVWLFTSGLLGLIGIARKKAM